MVEVSGRDVGRQFRFRQSGTHSETCVRRVTKIVGERLYFTCPHYPEHSSISVKSRGHIEFLGDVDRIDACFKAILQKSKKLREACGGK